MSLNKTLLALALGLSLTACEPQSKTNKQIQAEKAEAAAQSIQFSENAEIENIKGRLTLTANPGLLGFVVLLNEMGQPVMYTGVKGKITSGSKRLTQPDAYDCNANGCYNMQAPSDEGTFGSSSEYIFFWTTSGQYVQWNGRYLYSDKPIRLTQDPLVVAVADEVVK